MFAFDRKTSFFFVILGIALLFLPKINLISFGARETAGIRADDLLLLFFSFFLFWGHLSTGKKISTIESSVMILVAFSIISFIFNYFFFQFRLIHVQANLLYALRIFEYFLFFYIGLYSSRIFSLNRIVVYYFLMNAGLMILQRLGWIGYWGLNGYEPSCTFRCAGITSFPSEMGMLLNIIFCYLLFQKDHLLNGMKLFFSKTPFYMPISAVYPCLLFFFVGWLLLINGSRICFLAHLAVFFYYLIRKIKYFYASCGLILVLSLVSVYLHQTNVLQKSTLIERSSQLFTYQNIDLISKVWDHIETQEDPIGKEIVKHDSKHEDTSWWMRIHKWLYALKIYLQHPQSYLQGIGPGFAMAALDGGILRILVEYGIIGFFLFFKLFYQIGKTSETLKFCIFAFLINMLFIDVHLAYKVMSMLFFLTGHAQAKKYGH